MADEGIAYQFKIDQQTASLDLVINKIDRLIDTMGKANRLTEQSARQNKKHEESFKGVGKSIDDAKDKLDRFFQFVGAAIVFEVLDKLFEKITGIGKEALNAAAAAERMDLSFKLSLGTEGGEEMLGWLERISGKTEFTDRQLKGWGKELINAGIGAEEIDKYMGAALDVAAKSPDKMEGMGKAIMALSRASLTGKVDMRQLRGLSIGVEDLKTLPKFAGQSNDQIRKALEKGTLSKDDLLAVIAGPDKMLGNLGVKAGQTMEARFTHLSELPEKFYAKLSKTEAFDRLGRSLDGLLTKLDPDSPQGKRISEFLDGMLTRLASFVEEFDFDSALDVFIGGLNTVKDIIDVIGKGVSFLGDQWFEFASGLPGATGEIYQQRYRKRLSARRLSEDTDRGKEMAQAPEAKEDYADLDAALKSGALKSYWKQGEDAGDDIGAGMEKGMRRKTKTNSPSELFADLGRDLADGLMLGLGDSGGGNPRAAGISISIGPVAINAGSAEGGQAAADAFAVSLRSQLISILEQAQAEAGA